MLVFVPLSDISERVFACALFLNNFAANVAGINCMLGSNTCGTYGYQVKFPFLFTFKEFLLDFSARKHENVRIYKLQENFKCG